MGLVSWLLVVVIVIELRVNCESLNGSTGFKQVMFVVKVTLAD